MNNDIALNMVDQEQSNSACTLETPTVRLSHESITIKNKPLTIKNMNVLREGREIVFKAFKSRVIPILSKKKQKASDLNNSILTSDKEREELELEYYHPHKCFKSIYEDFLN